MNETKNNRTTRDDEVMGLGDYLSILKRRTSLILLTAMAVSVIAVVVVRRMPNIYRAETMILVDPQQVPNNYVASTVSTTINDRLSTIQQQVTSPTRLKHLIESMNLYAEMRKSHSEQEVVAAMQKAISVEVVERGGRSLSAFTVGFSGKDPVQVAAVANRLAEMFISENLKAREKQSYGTAEFLDDELKRTKEQLEQKQTALNDVKSKYMLDLPESKQYHLEALTTLRSQLQASQDRVNQAQQQKVYLQSMMATQAPTVDLDSGGADSTPEVQKLEAQLSALRTRYGDKHPDVRKMEAELHDLKAARKAAAQARLDAPPAIQTSGSPAHKRPRNPVLSAQIEKLDEQIEKERTSQQELQQQIAFHVNKLEKIPAFEQRIAGMMWDYDSLRAHYSELESKKLSADMASALETRDQGERFVVLDRAVVPTHPYAPKRLLLSGAGSLFGLLFGLGFAVLLEVVTDTVSARADVLKLLGETPILAEVPRIRTSSETLTQRLRLGGAFLATATGSVLVGLALSFLVAKL